ncbi:MAG: hypothetical protein ABIJ75_10825 [Actinomycetota bacterium]
MSAGDPAGRLLGQQTRLGTVENINLTDDERRRSAEVAVSLSLYDPFRWGSQDSTEWNRTLKAAEAMVVMSRDYPELMDLVAKSPSAAAMVPFTQWIIEQATGAAGLEAPSPAELINAFTDVYDEAASYFYSSEAIAAGAEADMELQVSLNRPLQDLLVTKLMTEGEGILPGTAELRAEAGVTVGVDETRVRATEITEMIPGGVKTRIITTGDGRMVFAFEQGDTTTYTDVALDPGTEVGNALDAYFNLALALAGVKHTVTRDTTTDPQTGIGTVIQHTGNMLDAVGRVWDNSNAWFNWTFGQAKDLITLREDLDVRFETSTTRRAREVDEIAATAVQQAYAGMTDPIGLVTYEAQQTAAENPEMGVLPAASFGLNWLSNATAEEQEQLRGEITSATDPLELERDIRAQINQESGLKQAVDKTITYGIEGLAMYGHMLDSVAVHILDSAGDIVMGAARAAGIGFEYDGPTGLEAFKSTWDWTEANRLSEYLHIEGTAGQWVDFIAAVAVDPFVWITMGAGAARRGFIRDLVSPEGVERLLARRTTQRLADDILYAMRTDDVIGARMMLKGMDPRLKMQITKATTRDELLDIMRKALPGSASPGVSAGTWLLEAHGHTASRNSAMMIERMSRAAAEGGKAGEAASKWLTKHLGGFSRDKARSIAPSQFMDNVERDLMELNYMDRAAATEWLEKADQLYKDYWAGGAVQRDAAQREMDQVVIELAALRSESPYPLRALAKQNGFRNVDEMIAADTTASRRVAAIDTDLNLARERLGTATPAYRTRLEADIVSMEQERALITTDRWAEVQTLKAEKKGLQRRYATTEKQATAARPLRTPEVTARLRKIDRELAGLLDEPMIRAVSASDDVWRTAAEDAAEFLTKQKTILKKMEAAKVLKGATMAGEQARDPFARFYAKFYEWYGKEKLGLPELAGRTNPYTGNPALQWDLVTGSKRYAAHTEDDIEHLWPILAGTDYVIDPAVRKTVYEMGVFQRQANFYAPASNAQMIAYAAIKDSRRGLKWWNKYLASTVRGPQSAAGAALAEIGLWSTRIWAGNLLLTPFRAFRSGLEEALRWAATTGRALGGRRNVRIARTAEDSSVGIAGSLERATERSPGPLVGSLSQFSPARAAGMGLRRTPAGEYTARQAFSIESSMRRTPGAARWRLADPAVKAQRPAHRDAVFTWVNTTLFKEDGHRAWARTIVDTAEERGITIGEAMRLRPQELNLNEFVAWWEQGGKNQVASRVARVGDRIGTAGMNDVIATMNQTASLLFERSTSYEKVSDLLVRRAATPGGKLIRKAKADEAIVRMFGPMPSRQLQGLPGGRAGSALSTADRVIDSVFDVMYGIPGENRYGMIHEDYFSRALGVLHEAHSKAGTLMTPETLARRVGIDVDEAARMMTVNQDRVAAIAYENHMVTPEYLETVADRFARDNARHLMYQPGATSLLGGKVQRVAPFAPAQFDFMSWWAHEYTKAATVGMFGKYAQIPNPFDLRALSRNLRGIPTTMQALPLNLRLLARSGEIGGQLAKEFEEQPDERAAGGPVNLTLGNVFNELTFYPMPTDPTSIMIDLGLPGLHPVMGWIFKFLPEQEDLTDLSPAWQQLAAGARDVMETFQPALGYGDDSHLTTSSLMGSIFKNDPNTATNLLQQVGELGVRSARWAFGGADRGSFFGGEIGPRPPGYREMVRYNVASYAGGIPAGTVNLVGSDEWLQTVGGYLDDAMSRAEVGSIAESAARMFPLARYLVPSDDIAVDQWSGFIAELPSMVGYGWVGAAQAGDLERLWRDDREHTISDSDLGGFVDAAKTMFFGLRDINELAQSDLIVRHPELAAQMVSTWECARHDETGLFVGPDEACRPDGRPDLLPGPEGLKQLIKGKDAGWYVERPDTELFHEVEYRVAHARKDILKWGWGRLTGREWDPGSAADTAAARAAGDVDFGAVKETDPYMYEMLERVGFMDGDIPDRMPWVAMAGEFQRLGNVYGSVTPPWSQNPAAEGLLLQDAAWRYPDGVFSGEWLVKTIQEMRRDADDLGYGDDMQDWPEEWRGFLREQFGHAIDLVDGFSAQVYADNWERLLGPIGDDEWKVPVPPPLGDPGIERVYQVASPSDIIVVDGDTVNILMNGEWQPIRLIGINAPDEPMPGWELAHQDMYSLLNNEGWEITIVWWETERFGAFAGRDYVSERPRLKAWLYADGVPVYNVEEFTSGNPLGISAGHVYRPLTRPDGSTWTPPGGAG